MSVASIPGALNITTKGMAIAMGGNIRPDNMKKGVMLPPNRYREMAIAAMKPTTMDRMVENTETMIEPQIDCHADLVRKSATAAPPTTLRVLVAVSVSVFDLRSPSSVYWPRPPRSSSRSDGHRIAR